MQRLQILQAAYPCSPVLWVQTAMLMVLRVMRVEREGRKETGPASARI